MSELNLAPLAEPAPADPGASVPEPTEAPPAAPTPVALADEALLEFKVNGEVVRKPWSEVRQTQAMLPTAFFEKTRALADQRRQVDEFYSSLQQQAKALEERESTIRSALSDPNQLGALYLAALSRAQGGQAPSPPAAPATPSFDPNSLLKVLNEQLDSRFQQMQQATQAQTINQDLDAFGRSLLKDTRLGKLRGADNLLWGEVLSMQPATIEEAREMARTVATDLNRQLNEVAAAEAATRTATAAKAVATIEPTGGHAPLPQPRQYSGLDDPKRRDDMIAYIQQRLAEG